MELGVALIGTGFMGKAHAMAYRSQKAIMGRGPLIRLETLVDTPAEKAADFADQFGFARSTADWREVLDDPRIDVVSITTPNRLHREMAVAALQAGKHVWCEKPMALTLDEAEEMAAAARASGKVTMVGYNYIHNPAVTHAAKLVAEGRIGRIVHVRGWVDEDYQADEDLPWTWRAQIEEAGLGVLGDMACHLVSMIERVAGPIESVMAEMQTVYETRAMPDGSGRGRVENEDIASALIRMKNGATGSISASRAAWGRKGRLDFEIHGTKGMIVFCQERMNELQLYVNEGPKAEQGFRTILTSPEHPPYGRFVPAPGHQIGFLDLKTIEAAELFSAIGEGRPAKPGFEEALHIERAIHAMADSARAGGERRLIEG